MSDRVILTLAAGPDAEAMLAISRPFLERYAQRCGAELAVHDRIHDFGALPPSPGWVNHSALPPDFTAAQLTKLDLIREALTTHRRVLWLDVDTLVRPDAPDLFDLVPQSHWAAFDECAVMSATPSWADGVHLCHRHMVEVCREDGLPIPESHGRCFNCGVQLASRGHEHLYAPAANPHDFGWAEQSRVSVRVFLSQIPVYHLPDCFNSMMWFVRPDYLRTCYIAHCAGIVGGHDRIIRMARDAEFWREQYPEADL